MGSITDGHMQIVALISAIISVVIYLLTSFWVYIDAKKIEKQTSVKTRPIVWLLSCLGVWIIAYPIYIFYRGGVARTIGVVFFIPMVILSAILNHKYPIDLDRVNTVAIRDLDKNQALISFIKDISGVWQSDNSILIVSPLNSENISLLFKQKDIYAQILIGKQTYAQLADITLDSAGKQIVAKIQGGSRDVKFIIRQVWQDKNGFHIVIMNDEDGEQEVFSYMRELDESDEKALQNFRLKIPAPVIEKPQNSAPTPTPALTPTPIAPVPAPDTPILVPVKPLEQTRPQNTTDLEHADNFRPSFNCEKAFLNVEKMICSNKQLSQADVELNALYFKIVESIADKDRLAALKKSQIDWMKNTRNQCQDLDCVKISYESRVVELKAFLSNMF